MLWVYVAESSHRAKVQPAPNRTLKSARRQWAFMNAQILPSQADTWNAGVLYGEAFAEYSMRYMNIFALQQSDEDSAESYKYKYLVKLECQKLPKE